VLESPSNSLTESLNRIILASASDGSNFLRMSIIDAWYIQCSAVSRLDISTLVPLFFDFFGLKHGSQLKGRWQGERRVSKKEEIMEGLLLSRVLAQLYMLSAKSGDLTE